MSQCDVLIIGSGISALTSAALLAKNGKSVTVLEQHSKPGGYMHSFRRFGETYDSGAHYFGACGNGQPFRILLDYLGVDARDLFCPLDPTGFDILRFPEGEIAIPQGYESVISELTSTFPAERTAIRSYFEMIRTVVNYFPTYRFSDTNDPLLAVESLETPLQSVVEKLTSNRRLQSVLYAYCNLHGVSPHETPFGFHAIVTDSLIEGAYGLLGGGDELVKRFVSQIEAAGGQILTKHRVNSIRVKDRNVSEVSVANGATFRGDWIISSIHPKATFRLLDDRSFLTPAFRERLETMKESSGVFGIYATSDRGQFHPLRNYFHFKSSDPRVMFAPFAPDEEPPVVFASTPRRIVGGTFPKGKRFPVSFLSPCTSSWFGPWKDEKYGARSTSYQTFKSGLVDQALSLVRRYDPELISGVTEAVSSSPLTNLHFNGAEDGAAYGIYHSIQNTGARALGPRTKVVNLLLTGQSCVFPGLLGASIAALRTCGHIVGIKPVLRELRERGELQ